MPGKYGTDVVTSGADILASETSQSKSKQPRSLESLSECERMRF